MASEMNDREPSPSAVSSTLEDTYIIVDDTANPGEEILRDAAVHCIEVNPLGFEEARLTMMDQEIADLAKAGKYLIALTVAVNHACRWAFLDAYRLIFSNTIGIDNISGISNGPHLSIGLSFRAEVDSMMRETKVWVAQRILSFMRRSYVDAEFPEPLLILELSGGNKRPSLLLSSIPEFPDLAGVFEMTNYSCRITKLQILYRLNVENEYKEHREMADAPTEGDHSDVGGREPESANE
ncbi:hypothetical protein GQX73_g9096 [Xylaria multiplex]|uniref:Uncharacterized protein n=1 Tax=Xylaria multiplex TaxID=323545 RepID=A0A7C8IIR2_9PEZI|nr:hypothetical protein GQX73_g9096 [Xylaria multiplex]